MCNKLCKDRVEPAMRDYVRNKPKRSRCSTFVLYCAKPAVHHGAGGARGQIATSRPALLHQSLIWFIPVAEVELPQKPCDSTALLRLPVVPCPKALSTATALRHQGNSTPAANSSARHTALQKAAALYGDSMAHTALPLVHADGVISIATGDKRVPLLSQIHSSVRQLPDVSEQLGGAKAGILQEAVAAGSAQGSWGLVLGLEAPGGSPSSILDVCIAKLAPGRMLACARSKLWWMTPEWRSSTRSLPPEIQFLLVEVQPGGQGPYALLLPLIDGDFRATLRPAE